MDVTFLGTNGWYSSATGNTPCVLLDHIIGFHTLSKFKFKQELTIYGQKGTEKILNNVVNRPFTVSFSELPFKTSINELTEGTHNIPFPVTCRFLLHSDPCLGYRVTDP